MQFVNKGITIGEWLKKYAYLSGITKILSEATGIKPSTIYTYVESDRDIRVTGTEKNPEIWEIKRLSK